MICELKIEVVIKNVNTSVTREIAPSVEVILNCSLLWLPKEERRDVRGVFSLAFVSSLRISISSGGEGIQVLPVHISAPSGLKIAPPFSGGIFSHFSPPHTNF